MVPLPLSPLYSCTNDQRAKALLAGCRLDLSNVKRQHPCFDNRQDGQVWGLSPQALPWRSTLLESAGDIESWQTTVLGTEAVFGILAEVLPADESVRAAVVEDGSLDAAVQRIK